MPPTIGSDALEAVQHVLQYLRVDTLQPVSGLLTLRQAVQRACESERSAALRVAPLVLDRGASSYL